MKTYYFLPLYVWLFCVQGVVVIKIMIEQRIVLV